MCYPENMIRLPLARSWYFACKDNPLFSSSDSVNEGDMGV